MSRLTVVEVTTSYLKKINSRISLDPKKNMLSNVETNPDNINTTEVLSV
jgi:hypothetical protein